MHKAMALLAAVFSFANLTAAHAADGTFRVTLLGSDATRSCLCARALFFVVATYSYRTGKSIRGLSRNKDGFGSTPAVSGGAWKGLLSR